MADEPKKEKLEIDGTKDLIVLDYDGVSVIDAQVFYNTKSQYLYHPNHIKKQITYQEYMRKTDKRFSKHNLLPMNTRFIKNYPQAGNWNLLVIEEEPQIRTIRTVHHVAEEITYLKGKEYWNAYGLEGSDERGKKYDVTNPRDYDRNPFTFRLSFPFIVYIMAFNNDNFYLMNVFFRLSPITSMADYLLLAPLHNIPEEQSICLGRWKDNLPPTHGLYEEATAVIETFWNAKFNNDYNYNYKKYFDNPELSSYFSWQYHTQQDPMFIFKTKWIQTNTLENQIKKFEERTNLNSSTIESPFSYNKIWEAMMNKTSTNDNAPVINNPESKPVSGRISNFTNSIYLGETSLSVGDNFKYQDINYIVEDFIGTAYSHSPSHIKVSNADKPEEVSELEFSSALKKSLNSSLGGERTRKKVTLANGVEIKVGDIISYFDERIKKEIFKKVDSIRLGLDKKNHVSFVGAQGHYYADLLQAKVADLSGGIKLQNGTVIKENESYWTLGKDNSLTGCVSVSIIRRIKVTKFDIYSGSMGIMYEQEGGSRNQIQLEQIEDYLGKIVDDEYMKSLIEVTQHSFIIGNSIIRIPNPYIHKMYLNPDTLQLNVQYTAAGESCRNFNDIIFSDDRAVDFSKILIEDNKRLYIPGYDFDIDFKIGDKVFVGDWSKGNIDPFKLRTIESFVIDNSKGWLNIVTNDSSGILLNTPYIANNRVTRVGMVRKAVSEFKNIKRGDVLKCKVKGYVDFPMVAKNSVLGIITDSAADAMIVFSNGCTLWWSDVKNFSVLEHGTIDESTFNTDQFKKFPIAPGNMYMTRDRLYPYIIMEYINNVNELASMNANKNSRLKLINHMNGSSVCSASEADIKYYATSPFGLPVPRLGGTEYVAKTIHSAIPSVHGGYIKVPNCRFGSRVQKFIN